MISDDDEERGRLGGKKKAKWANRLVNPQTAKVILAAGPWIAKILGFVIELVKLLKT